MLDMRMHLSMLLLRRPLGHTVHTVSYQRVHGLVFAAVNTPVHRSSSGIRRNLYMCCQAASPHLLLASVGGTC
jgi:hypothetical protein